MRGGRWAEERTTPSQLSEAKICLYGHVSPEARGDPVKSWSPSPRLRVMLERKDSAWQKKELASFPFHVFKRREQTLCGREMGSDKTFVSSSVY